MKCLLFICVFILLLPTSHSSQCTCSCDSERMDEVGRAGWRLIHSLAANYPDEPVFYQKYPWYGFIETLINFYPCEYCRAHLWRNVEKYGIHTANKTDLSMFMCFLHNDINIENGKPPYPCSMEKLNADYGFANSNPKSDRIYID
jgi:hypothetical protein